MKHAFPRLVVTLLLFCAVASPALPSPGIPADCCTASWPVPPAILLGDERPWEVLSPQYRRKVYQGDRLTMVLFEIVPSPSQGGAPLSLHSHAHEQVTYVMEGQAVVQVGSLRRPASAGSVYIIPSGVPHGLQVTSRRFVGLDVFSPVRRDFGVGANEVKAFVHRWFSWFDHQVDESVFLEHLASSDLLMRFPEADLHDHVEFRRWYAGIRETIASNTHDVQVTAVHRKADGSFEVEIEVDWRARTRAGSSLHLQVHQHWDIRPDVDGHFKVQRYIVTPLKK